MKATEKHFPVVLFIMLYKVVLTFESVDEILTCDHSNESYQAVLSCGAVYYAVQDGPNVLSLWMKSLSRAIQMKTMSSKLLWVFPMVLFIMLYKMVLTFQSTDENLKYDHSNDRSFRWRCISIKLTLGARDKFFLRERESCKAGRLWLISILRCYTTGQGK